MHTISNSPDSYIPIHIYIIVYSPITCLFNAVCEVVAIRKNEVETIKADRNRSIGINCERGSGSRSFHRQTFTGATANITVLSTTQCHQCHRMDILLFPSYSPTFPGLNEIFTFAGGLPSMERQCCYYYLSHH